MAWWSRSRRGRRTRHKHARVSQELGTPCGSFSTEIGTKGQPNPKVPGPRPPSAGLRGANTAAAGRYRQANDKEARRNGPQGIGAPHGTDEAGEPNPRGPGGGTGAPGCGT